MLRHLQRISDLGDQELVRILERAEEHRRSSIRADAGRPLVVGLVFLQTSLRTRLGFAAASSRLGWHAHSVIGQRSSSTSMAESMQDTVRIVAGFADIVVARVPCPVADIAQGLPAPLVNGGDSGPDAEHPTQALLDVFAMECELGPIEKLHIAICGDLRFRACRSLMRLLARRPPAKLSLVTVPDLIDGHSEKPINGRTPETRTLAQIRDVDVLYVAGIPHRAIPENVRDTLRVTADVMAGLRPEAIVLSPMPVIDEIDAAARKDRRVKMFRQSDHGLFVRMAILEHVANWHSH